MKPRERFITALRGGIPDRVPVHDHLFSQRLMQELLGYTTELYDGSAQILLAKKLEMDSLWTPINGFCGIEDIPHKQDEIYKDEWGVTYQKNGWPIIAQIDTPIKSREDWEKYKMPDVNTEGRLKILRDAYEENDGELAIVLGILGQFTMMSWYFMDFSTLAITMYTDPELVHEINEAYTNWALSVVRLAVDKGYIDCVQISDDWGSTTSLLISPNDFRTFFIPYFRRLVKGIKEMGIPVIMHNDGCIWDILDDIVESGINALNPIERAASMDLKVIKERYNGKIVPIGNVNNKVTMSSNDPEDVRREVMECIDQAAAGGGYIISTDHSFHDLIPTENIYMFIKTAHEYGQY